MSVAAFSLLVVFRNGANTGVVFSDAAGLISNEHIGKPLHN